MIFGIIIGNYSANIVINIKPFGMKNNTFSDRIIPFVSKTALALASGLFLVSCGVQSGYTETDGIYYDPATDKIERKIAWQEPELVLRVIIPQESSDKLRKTNNYKTKNTATRTGAETASESLPALTGELMQELRIISTMTIILGGILITAVFIRHIISGIIIHTSVILALQDGD